MHAIEEKKAKITILRGLRMLRAVKACVPTSMCHGHEYISFFFFFGIFQELILCTEVIIMPSALLKEL